MLQDMKEQLGYRFAIEDYLIKPVQRIMKYQLLLRDFVKYTERSGLDIGELKVLITHHALHTLDKSNIVKMFL